MYTYIKHKIIIFFLLMTISISSTAHGFEYNSLEEKNIIQVYENTLPSIVSIEADIEKGTSGGTGCIISKNGIILTSSHVIEHAKNIIVTTHSGKEYGAKVLAILRNMCYKK